MRIEVPKKPKMLEKKSIMKPLNGDVPRREGWG